jgi:hypothetical protein
MGQSSCRPGHARIRDVPPAATALNFTEILVKNDVFDLKKLDFNSDGKISVQARLGSYSPIPLQEGPQGTEALAPGANTEIVLSWPTLFGKVAAMQ